MMREWKMLVNIFTNPCLEEEHTDIYCWKKNGTIEDIAEYIRMVGMELSGWIDNEQHRIFIKDILYFETVDKKSFACTEHKVFEVEYPLKFITELFESTGFVRISKSVVVNIYKIEFIKHDFEMRILAHLVNQEVLVINRSYRKNFQYSLNRLKERGLGGQNGVD